MKKKNDKKHNAIFAFSFKIQQIREYLQLYNPISRNRVKLAMLVDCFTALKKSGEAKRGNQRVSERCIFLFPQNGDVPPAA